jgi:hypothetical chaperone protein
LIEALRIAMPEATLVEGNRFGGVAAGLAWAGAVQRDWLQGSLSSSK